MFCIVENPQELIGGSFSQNQRFTILANDIANKKAKTISMSAIDLNQNLVSVTNQSLDYIKYEQNINFVNREQGVDGCYPNNGQRLFLCL